MYERSLLDLGAPLAPGELCVVPGGAGLVVFAHADGEARTTRRSADLALRLQRRELGTLLFDLLGPDESHATLAQDVPLLTTRLEQVLQALPPELKHVPIGLIGTDAGAAAALVVAARRPQQVRAVVSRGGRPDLAGAALGDVRAPTLLLVGAADAEVLELNRQAYARLRGEKRIDLVPRATHLFLEAGALDAVAQHAGDWFLAHLGPPPAR
ncbi:alpha/beta fold hydrolase [Piscinibacter sp.]|uniref:alpha/beta fold hydrolase n=1 Tax=Piscinibacter sp. TaxID=1903157 RepID=UPI002585F3E2|nr:alpha/beta fold hydrolase [Piscinibacter sp.]